jgi:hypothetical protein
MLKLSLQTIAVSAGAIQLLALLITASPLVWIASIAADLIMSIFPGHRTQKLVPVKVRIND